MKKLVYLSVLLGVLFIAKPSTAQIRINIQIGSEQPLWGPAGYDDARYYYMPEYDLYYDVMKSKYVWWEANQWQIKSKLPVRLAKVDLFHTYKVVLQDKNPWHNHRMNQSKYYTYSANRNQVNIKGYKSEDKRDYVAYHTASSGVGGRENNRINAVSPSNIRSENSPKR